MSAGPRTGSRSWTPAFDWKGPEEFASFMNRGPLAHVVLSFFPTTDGTEVHLIHSEWRQSPAWEKARTWFERA